MEVVVNYWALLGCVVYAMVVGFAWYGPLFGKAWAKAMGIDMEAMKSNPNLKKRMPLYYAGSALLSLMSIIGLAVLFEILEVDRVHEGIQTAFLVAMAFAVPVQGINALWSTRPKRQAWELFFITAGYQLVAFIVYGIILAL